MGYRFLEHTADILFEAYGKDLKELFTSAALAAAETEADLDSVDEVETIGVELSSKSIEGLLFDFLEEIIYYKDAEQLLLKSFDIDIEEKEGKYLLKAYCKGEKIDQKKHRLRNDIKAVTLHKFKVEKRDNVWKAIVILDI